jgi:hypothetical protein
MSYFYEERTIFFPLIIIKKQPELKKKKVAPKCSESRQFEKKKIP